MNKKTASTIQEIIADFKKTFKTAFYSYEFMYDTHFLKVDLEPNHDEEHFLDFILASYNKFDNLNSDEILIITNEELMTTLSNRSSFRLSRNPISIELRKEQSPILNSDNQESDEFIMAA